MANNAFRNPANTAVAQVKTITITADSTSNTAVWTATLTKDNGDTETVTYTEDGSPTVAEIATGLTSAWNASVKPGIARITAANPSSGVMTLTADTAGMPFSVALADSDDGTHTETATTANVGNSDYGTARNWQRDAVPVATDDVLIDVSDSNTSVDLLYSLNQSSVAIADFRVLPGYTGNIGRFEDNLPMYLKIDPDLFRYEGGGQLALFDIGSANIDCYINSRGTPKTGRHAVYLKGSNIATVYAQKGNIGIAPLDADTATVATIQVGFVDQASQDANVTVGTGVTLTTLNQLGGYVDLRCAATTVTCGVNGTLRTQGSGAITTLNCYGSCILDSTGTITTLNCYGTVDLSRSRAARTVTTLNLFPGCRVILGSWITLTNKLTPPSTGAGMITVEIRA